MLPDSVFPTPPVPVRTPAQASLIVLVFTDVALPEVPAPSVHWLSM
jgi:hypothetical protein